MVGRERGKLYSSGTAKTAVGNVWSTAQGSEWGKLHGAVKGKLQWAVKVVNCTGQ